MKKKVRFVTFYPKCHNLGLFKDVGQIPNTLGIICDNIDSKVVSSIVDLKDDNIKQIKGMEIEKIPFVFRSELITGLVYILRKANRIDWFNFYHGGRKVYYWTLLYKILNPNGKVYLKMDLNYAGCEKYSSSTKEQRIFRKVAKVVDIISVESEAIRDRIKNVCDVDVKIISNGYISNESIDVKPVSKRKKEFITVGRLGTPPKATDLLLEAFYNTANQHDWNLRLVGPVDEKFAAYKNNFFENHPEMKNRVFFEGIVYDKNKLYDLYNSARVFVLPSKWEGFPLVGPEAAHCGCRMILTDIIPPIKELTNNQRFGISIRTNNVGALASALLSEAKRGEDEEEPFKISEYAAEVLSWERNCKRLVEYMMVVDNTFHLKEGI